MSDLTPEARLERGRLWRSELDSLPERVVEAAITHLYRWSVPLSPERIVVTAASEETDFTLTLRDVLAYARTGRASDWSAPTSARDALLSISILYDGALTEKTVPADWIDATELEGVCGELAEVCRAALARVHLAEGLPVPRHWLAALAGVSVQLVSKAVGAKALRCGKRRPRGRGLGARDIDPTSARAWLAARGVIVEVTS